ncbi:S41 family peptidase [Sandaracinobacteroides saxicola]|uniref:S41 family peptidase n=1 Tax=Sandaracinobacteroides saxicola TaxID=2759707 RepID=A0A7G5IHV1_9SPHN|nr:S41 family peptidase [Sandaracinobacteroides saxicola]QMW22943.1 S41 family peptidase [Sandaracinobacteroides saxicola]
MRALSLLIPALLLSSSLTAQAVAPAAPVADAARPADTYKQLDTLMDVFLKVRETYVDKVDDKTLIEGAINGMLASLDPHSSYLDARDNANMKSQTEGEYGGLGLTVTQEDGAVKVVSPTDETPAARAGIKAGDFITHLDGNLLFGSTLNDAVDRMRGTPGTKIRLTIVRPGSAKPMEMTLTREIVKIRPVRFEARGAVGLIRIASFNRQTGPATRDAIASLQKSIGPSLAGYVIDLRSNPGGLLDQAIDVSDAFMTRGEIVSQRGRAKEDIQRYYARGDDLTQGKPVVVLIDEGSASASEIVAGALQDSKRALVLGQRSFGKGSVQTLLPLSADTGLRLTTARYFTPSGRSVQENGIEPDINVPQLTDPDRKERPRVREADLRNHLINEKKADDKLIEDDGKPDPRFAETIESLRKRGVTDFQLDYALRLVGRLGPVQSAALAAGPAGGAAGGATPK